MGYLSPSERHDKRMAGLQKIADNEGSAPAGAAALDQPPPIVEVPAPGTSDPIFKTYRLTQRYAKELGQRRDARYGRHYGYE